MAVVGMTEMAAAAMGMMVAAVAMMVAADNRDGMLEGILAHK
jgi:hypothetical protein